MRNTQKALADLAYSLESVEVKSREGSYLFRFEQEGFPSSASDAYDVDIDIIPSHKKQSVIASLSAESLRI